MGFATVEWAEGAQKKSLIDTTLPTLVIYRYIIYLV